MATDWMDRYLDAWNSHDASQVAGFMAADATYEDVALGQLHEVVDAIKGFVDETASFSSDYHFSPVTVQASGTQYAMEWEMSGTNTGDIAGLPATNKPYRIRGVSIGQLDAEGKVEHNRDYWNLADYLIQVGILPPPGE
jgi:steroid delta-isomerase-like uncharacterized protein